MAKKERRFHLYNRIWFPVVTLMLVIATIWGTVGSFMPSTLALEQETRCQMEEHVHTDVCYLDNILICEKKAHTHNENCYLVLLENNDINTLLTAVDNDKNKSLEGVIDTTLTQALAAEGVAAGEEKLTFVGGTEPSASPSPTPTPTPTPTPDPSPSTTRGDEDPYPSTTRGDEDPLPSTTRGDDAPVESPVATLSLTGTTLTDLNNTITENNIGPGLTLNSNLYAAKAVANEVNSGIQTYALGGTASTATNAINFYIMVDGTTPVFVSSGTLTETSDGWNTYWAYSYDLAATAYQTDSIVTSLTSNNINSTYFFRGSNNMGTSFGESVSHSNSRRRISFDESATQYVTFATRSGQNWNRVYTSVPFWTVTLDYSAINNGPDNIVQYVQNGLDSTLPLSADYDWEFANGTAATASALNDISNITTLYARPKGHTVTFNSNGGSAVASQTVTPGGYATKPANPTRTGYDFVGWYSDTALTSPYDFVYTPVTSDLTLYAKWAPTQYTITYTHYDGTEYVKVQEFYDDYHTLLPTLTGQSWTINGTPVMGDGFTVEGNVTLRAGIVVTFSYAQKATATRFLAPNTTITLPTDLSSPESMWVAEDGTNYKPGASFTVTQTTYFVESTPLKVTYTVNFPTTFPYTSGLTVRAPATKPTLYGTAVSTISDTISAGNGTTARTVSQTMVKLDIQHDTYKTAEYPVLFRGWRTETGELISPYSQLSWQELQGYDKVNEDGVKDGNVELTGVWVCGTDNTALFFVLLNSTTNQMGSTSAKDYTDVIFSTYIGNATTATVGENPYNASNDAAAVVNDGKIRAMHGEQADSIWFYTFPTDDEIFASLKTYAEGQTLTVGTEKVKVEDLNSNEYAIRWYKIKHENDGWHVDAKLTRKVGVIEVSKTFSGNDTLIASAKTNFSITATNGTRSVTLNAANAIDDGDGNPNTWFWRIADVKYNEQWTLTESANTDNTVIHYAEWAVTDSSVNHQTGNGTGSTVTVRGVTYASDLANPEWLQVSFNNIYYHKDSLMIKKADGVTGEALSGAQFQLYQNDVRMTFDYNTASGMYVYNTAGTGAYSTLVCDGYVNIAATGFTFD